MAESATKLPITRKPKAEALATGVSEWRPLESLRHEVDRLFEQFDQGFWPRHFGRVTALDREFPLTRPGVDLPSVDIVESETGFELTAELPGMDEKNINVTLANGTLTIKGEKSEEREEKKKNYHLSERTFGSFERRFQVPEGVDVSKIEASFKKGVLTIAMPKSPEARKSEKKIAIKSG